MTRRRRRFALAGLALVGLLLVVAVVAPELAWARPGGGESYSGGGGHGGGGGGGGDSGGGGAGLLIELVIRLLIYYPQVGVPVLLIVIAFFVIGSIAKRKNKDWDSGPPVELEQSVVTIDAITRVDPDFSLVVFEDFVYRLYATAQGARGVKGKLDELAPYVGPAARTALASRPPIGQPVTGVVIGAMRTYRVDVPSADAIANPAADHDADASSNASASMDVDPDAGSMQSLNQALNQAPTTGPRTDVPYVTIGLQFEANYSVGTGKGSKRFAVEDWVLRRAANVRTRAPGKDRSFPCPNCGAPWQTSDAAGTQKCASCGQVVDNGRFDWQVVEVNLRHERNNLPSLTEEVPERGTSLPTYRDDRFDQRWLALTGDDPDVNDAAINARLLYIYRTVNDAWTANDLTPARTVVSDGLADYLQYWLDAYKAQGLRNLLVDMRITYQVPAKLVRDAHYDALTIRIWATGKDYVETTDGRHVRGSRHSERKYSEYWTLIRSAKRKGPPRADGACSNCGAPLTITMAGECSHCGTHVTAGEFDWVLSKIEQDDSYRG